MAGAVNTIIEVRPPDVIVATGKSPAGQPVPIASVEQALHRLAADGTIPIEPSEIGYRSAFIGAVLKTLPGSRVEGRKPPVIHWSPAPRDAASLDDDDPRWAQHTGGSGHDHDPEWVLPDDLSKAEAFYGHLTERARIIIDLLIDHPGRQLDVAEISALSGNALGGAHAIAGSLQPLERLRVAAGRRYPFYWWGGQKGQTRYAMKPSVAELFRRARAALVEGRQPVAGGKPGVSYRPQDESVVVAPPAPSVSADPDSFGHGLRAHHRLQNQLAQFVTAHGLRPLSPRESPNYDLAWMTGDKAMTVVEVKSATEGNEVRQLRMGLGQILDYASSLRISGFTVQSVLYIEREPAGARRWLDITAGAGVLLVWPGTEDRLGL
ncbi:hypothetical protein SAMN05421748_122166 [Paractinoplanes atraurantiacus]|uniref:Uncharacterized protein n=1 Tax=Paractinoplanes atraurantiacus TaxID=1036182 RepID=A0A285JQS4_9ACTN|nr:hypothetical protein SAMN05421748_122166 [Actinoplanes atraurantiacus]